jgi:hypothetical protein
MATELQVFYRGTNNNFTPTNKILINSIVISNTSGSQQTYSISINGVSITTSAIIPANDTVILDMKQVVPASRQVSFTGTSCAFHFSGVEISA